MNGCGRDTPWRQGHVLPGEAIRLLLPNLTDLATVIVASHDCDIAQNADVESTVEVIIGCRVRQTDGNFTRAKNARRLHLTLSGGTDQLTVELEANQKKTIEKKRLCEFRPIDSVRMTVAELRILQRWLAARYRRAAFPDEFNARLQTRGLNSRLSRILKNHGASILAIYFDLDKGQEISRSGPEDTYALEIYLLYSTETDPDAAERAAAVAKTAIEKAFHDRCFSKETKKWTNIELVACEVVSDQTMTVQLAETLKRWSADYISLGAQPPQAMLNDV
jgi:hypothetical protein